MQGPVLLTWELSLCGHASVAWQRLSIAKDAIGCGILQDECVSFRVKNLGSWKSQNGV